MMDEVHWGEWMTSHGPISHCCGLAAGVSKYFTTEMLIRLKIGVWMKEKSTPLKCVATKFKFVSPKAKDSPKLRPRRTIPSKK